MLTKDDVKKLKELLATREDLELLATKEDLELLATKEALEMLATKEDLKLLATKEDTKAIRTDIINHDKRFDELAESVNKLRDDLDVRKDVERIKGVLRGKLHAEI